MIKLIFLLIFLVVVISAILLLINKGRKEYERTSKRLVLINKMPISDAIIGAKKLLRNSKKFQCIEDSEGQSSVPDFFSESVKHFLCRYSHVKNSFEPNIYIGRDRIKESERHPGYWVIGVGEEGTDVEFEISVMKGNETVYELHRGEPPDLINGTYSSIYHWIISINEEGFERT